MRTIVIVALYLCFFVFPQQNLKAEISDILVTRASVFIEEQSSQEVFIAKNYKTVRTEYIDQRDFFLNRVETIFFEKGSATVQMIMEYTYYQTGHGEFWPIDGRQISVRSLSPFVATTNNIPPELLDIFRWLPSVVGTKTRYFGKSRIISTGGPIEMYASNISNRANFLDFSCFNYRGVPFTWTFQVEPTHDIILGRGNIRFDLENSQGIIPIWARRLLRYSFTPELEPGCRVVP